MQRLAGFPGTRLDRLQRIPVRQRAAIVALRQLDDGASGVFRQVVRAQGAGPRATAHRLKPVQMDVAVFFVQGEMRGRMQAETGIAGSLAVQARRDTLGHGAGGKPDRRRLAEQARHACFQPGDALTRQIGFRTQACRAHIGGDTFEPVCGTAIGVEGKAEVEIAAGSQCGVHSGAVSPASVSPLQPTMTLSPASMTGRLMSVG